MNTLSTESQRVVEETRRNIQRRKDWQNRYIKRTGRMPLELLIKIMIDSRL